MNALFALADFQPALLPALNPAPAPGPAASVGFLNLINLLLGATELTAPAAPPVAGMETDPQTPPPATVPAIAPPSIGPVFSQPRAIHSGTALKPKPLGSTTKVVAQSQPTTILATLFIPAPPAVPVEPPQGTRNVSDGQVEASAQPAPSVVPMPLSLPLPVSTPVQPPPVVPTPVTKISQKPAALPPVLAASEALPTPAAGIAPVPTPDPAPKAAAIHADTDVVGEKDAAPARPLKASILVKLNPDPAPASHLTETPLPPPPAAAPARMLEPSRTIDPRATPASTPAARVAPPLPSPSAPSPIAFAAHLTPLPDPQPKPTERPQVVPVVQSAEPSPAKPPSIVDVPAPVPPDSTPAPQPSAHAGDRRPNGPPPPLPTSPAAHDEDPEPGPARPETPPHIPIFVAAPVDPPVPHVTAPETPTSTSAAPAFHPAAAQALRAPTPVQSAAIPLPRAPLAQEIAVRITPPNAPAVDLRLVERSGAVQVAVRTPDTGLQTTLRQDLGTFVNSMERVGYHAETFAPREAAVAQTSGGEMNTRDDAPESKPDFSGQGGWAGSSHGQQQQRQRDPRASEWLFEMENQS